MRSRLITLIALLVCLPALAIGAPADSTGLSSATDSAKFAALDTRLDEYMAALEGEPVRVKCSEVDFIISSCTEQDVIEHVARRVYDHYFSSKLMGDDAVAIHVFDTWFADRKVKMEDDDTFFTASFFARANRNSLIGCRAPGLTLFTPEMEEFRLFGADAPSEEDGAGSGTDGQDAPEQNWSEPEGRYSILYFYDVGCPKCLVESMVLRNVLEAHDWPLVLYAIYVGSHGDKWEEYRTERFRMDSPDVEVVHLWDPDLDSGFALQYGVFGTPKMFLVDPNGVVAGRGLDPTSLEQLLSVALETKTLEYGGDEAMEMFDRTFAEADPYDCGAVPAVAAHIAEMLLPDPDAAPDERKAGAVEDRNLYRQMTGDLLYYIIRRREAGFKCGAGAFIDSYILSRGDIWNTADDSLKVVSLALFMKDLLSLCPEGSALPQIDVPAEVLSRGAASGKGRGTHAVRSRSLTVDLSRQKDCAIVFYTEGCPLCAAERKAAREIIASASPVPGTRDVPSRIILVDMDEILSGGGASADRLMQSLDLSSLPFVLLLDAEGKVSRKYITLTDGKPLRS